MVALQTVSSIRTILSLNAVESMITNYVGATQEAYDGATQDVLKFGFANGCMMTSFLLSYLPIILYGSYLIYSSVQESGCDPSGSANPDHTCDVSGENVFGALFGVSFAGSVLPQVTGCIEAFAGARSAAYPALEAIYRDTKHEEGKTTPEMTEAKSQALQRRGSSAPLPRYVIDCASTLGFKPEEVKGHIKFKDVKFSYPSRLEVAVFDGFTLDIPAGKTVALVGTR
jgi:ATP-binding cassette subfamily B (MDR/TAP) protein 1